MLTIDSYPALCFQITAMAQAADVSFNTTIEATLTPQRFVTSTPFKVPVARATKKGKGKQKNFVRPVCDICEECGKEYRCHRSFIKHKRTHAIQGKYFFDNKYFVHDSLDHLATLYFLFIFRGCFKVSKFN